MGAQGSGATVLVARAARGDAEAFAALMEPLAPRLALYLRWRGGRTLAGDYDAEDALQLVLATAWRKLGDFEYRGPAALYRWLTALADGVLSDRRKYLDAARRPDLRHIESAGGAVEARDPATTISRRVARHEEWGRAADALSALEAEDRAVVERHLLQGQSVREIAAELGVGKSTVWDRLDRAMTRLRSALGATA